MISLKAGVYFRIHILVFIMAILFSALNYTIFHKLPKQIREVPTYGIPMIIYEDQEYLSTIDDVLVTNSYVYVLFGELHLVKVYDIYHNYVCTLIVSNEKSNGARAQIFVHEGTLYLLSANDIYEFVDNTFVRFHSYTEDTTMRLSINKNRHTYRNDLDGDGHRYYMKGESIYRSDCDGTEHIFLRRSPMYFLCNPMYSWSLWVLFFLLLIVPMFFRKENQ